MIRGVLNIQDGDAVEHVDHAWVKPPTEGFAWVDVQDQSPDDLRLLGERFGFHPLALEDCEHLDQRPKLEEYPGYLFIAMHDFTQSEEPLEVMMHEVHIFFSSQYLVTVHSNPHPAIDALWRQLLREPFHGERGADFLLYRLCDLITDSNFPTLEALSDAIETIEDEVLTREGTRQIERFVTLKRSLALMRRVISPQRELFATFLRRDLALVSEPNRVYFRDVYDHLVRLNELIDVERDLLGNARDAHFSMLGQRTNDIMRRLTLASIVFLPLTFITGFFGMNFAHLPFDNDGLLVAMLVSMLLLPVGMVVWFRRQRWFS